MLGSKDSGLDYFILLNYTFRDIFLSICEYDPWQRAIGDWRRDGVITSEKF